MDFEQYLTEALQLNEAEKEDKKPKDIVCISGALLMRLFELVHEEIEDNDEVLHHMVEKISELGKDDRVVVMNDYDEIKKVVDEELEDSEQDEEEQEKEEEEEDSSDEDQEDEESYE